MNDHIPTEELPDLSETTIARIESAVFAEIEGERSPRRPAADRSRARRRRWLTGAGIAAAFAVGVLVTPPILSAVGGSASITADGSGGGAVDESAPMTGATSPDRSAEVAPGAADSAESLVQTVSPEAGREIIATANATVQVKDVAKAADAIAALAEAHDGYVESTEVGKATAVDDTSMPVPPDSGYGWIGIRVPSDELTAVIDELGKTGEVLSSSISKQDVTSTAIDLRARVDSLKASVQRLTELMSQSGTVSELIEAEVALTDRQAQLESYEQQLAALEDQVAMSSLQVQLTKATAPTTADPAGFGDGLLAGWNGLVVSLNALVIAFGFILPWVAVAALVVLIVWLIRRVRRNRRTATAADGD
ncbi:DUF4349 domain-containing protein [Microbacterium hydrocarbonoxydans]|uniref:DUF4349 domain-containing protein n=1 Tax=Microbacterium hydrocarbonoxydans TaxID=273678 RepID=UPI0007BC4365|nr:DUF4349 domain-containing protein [Microbacterium hydrocarbonoxydans]GAT72946.1 hypothetical protein MHM582_1426 [Microbacterium sp. HM58-2]